MVGFPLRSILMASAALGLPLNGLSADDDTDEDRVYLPTEILVVGEADDYTTTDGSTGTKTPTALVDVPQTVQVITADQLNDQSIRQLGEALRYIPGVSLETGEGHRDEIFIRGQETTADFYLDGLRDDAQYYRSLYNVERVEVLKGANALIFGRGGGGGVVNRVSKKAQLSADAIDFDGSASTFGAFSVSGDVNYVVSDTVALRLNTTYEEFNNDRDFYEGRFFGASPTITAKLGADTTLTAHYSFDKDERVTDRGVPSFNGSPLAGFDQTFFGDPDFNRSDAEVHIARTRIDHAISDTVSLNASFQYANYDKVYANILPRGTNGTTVDFSGYRDFTKRENLIAQANLVWQVETGFADHTILAGIEASTQDTRNGRNDAVFADGIFGNSRLRTTAPLAQEISLAPIFLSGPVRSNDSNLSVLSGYIQDQIAFGEKFQIIAGFRWDRFDLKTTDLLTGTDGDRVDEKVSPRFGAIFKPIETLSIYASYAESFLPQAGDQFLILDPGTSAFDPEKFSNYEIGAKWLIQPDLFLTASIFRLERTNTRASDPNNSGLTVLTGASRTEGFEANLVGNIVRGWQANLGYTYMDGEITGASTFGAQGQRLQQLPEHQISAWNHFDLTDNFGLGLGVIYQGEQFTSFSNNVVLPDYVRIDAAAYYQFNDRIAVQVNVENLTDQNYYPSAHGDNNIQPGAPLSARIGIRVSM